LCGHGSSSARRANGAQVASFVLGGREEPLELVALLLERLASLDLALDDAQARPELFDECCAAEWLSAWRFGFDWSWGRRRQLSLWRRRYLRELSGADIKVGRCWHRARYLRRSA